jgi:hypothetical protein
MTHSDLGGYTCVNVTINGTVYEYHRSEEVREGFCFDCGGGGEWMGSGPELPLLIRWERGT